jgi:DNA-binding Lrp family transcriptional regulator
VITAVVLITAEKGALPTLGEALAAIPGVSEVYSVTGEFDFIAMVRAKAHDDLADVVTGRIAQTKGVAPTASTIWRRSSARRALVRGAPRRAYALDICRPS